MKMKNKTKRGIAAFAAAVTVLTGSLTASAKAVSDYMDVQPGHWYYTYVADVSERGLMTGLNDTYFGAGETLARAQVATILYRMAGSPQTEYSGIFPDVPDGQFYSDAVLWANQKGIVTGYTDTGTFGPSNSITRQELAVMMYRYAQMEGKPVDAAGDLEKFPDADWLSSYAYSGMSWATGIGLIQGMGTDGRLNPQGEISRAECATILSRYFTSTAACQHNWDGGTVIDAGDCLNPSTVEYKCTVCGTTKTEEGGYGSHNWKHEEAVYKEVTKTETHVFCSGCGEDFGTGSDGNIKASIHRIQAATGSDCQKGHYSKNVTITENVLETPERDICTICGATK